jgi:hypothetical protein
MLRVELVSGRCCRCASRKGCPTYSPSDGCALKVRRHYPIKTLERDAPQRCPYRRRRVWPTECVCLCLCVCRYVCPSLLTIRHPPPSHHPHEYNHPPNLSPSSISVGSYFGMWFGGHPAMGISFTGDSSDGGRVGRIHPPKHKSTLP